MSNEIRYDILVQNALRGVARAALRRAEKRGLPGDHHFYISFDTRAPGVQISRRLRERYPEEMTIILQHQFWGLEVSEQVFEVGLSFNNVPEKLVVPFAALRSFADPAAQFGLQFLPDEAQGERDKSGAHSLPMLGANSDADASEPASEDEGAPALSRPSSEPAPAMPGGTAAEGESRPQAYQEKEEEGAAEDSDAAPDDKTTDEAKKKSAEVVQLDTFRKK